MGCHNWPGITRKWLIWVALGGGELCLARSRLAPEVTILTPLPPHTGPWSKGLIDCAFAVTPALEALIEPTFPLLLHSRFLFCLRTPALLFDRYNAQAKVPTRHCPQYLIKKNIQTVLVFQAQSKVKNGYVHPVE